MSDWENKIGYKPNNQNAHPRSPAGGTGTGFSRRPGANTLAPSPTPLPISKVDVFKQGLFYYGAEVFSLIPNNRGKFHLLNLIASYLKKEDAPGATSLIRHYLTGSGEPVEVKPIPASWRAYVVRRSGGKPGTYKELKWAYDSGIYDFKNAFGHFDLRITAIGEKRRYELTDFYHFEYSNDPSGNPTFHGFELKDMTDEKIGKLRAWLPDHEYPMPNGTERWRLEDNDGVITLFIPHEFLINNGKPFNVRGSFEQ